jgi:hypothetical protein
VVSSGVALLHCWDAGRVSFPALCLSNAESYHADGQCQYLCVYISDPLFSRHPWKWEQQPVRYLVGTTSLAGRRKISAGTQGPLWSAYRGHQQDLPPRYRQQQQQRQLEEGYGELQTIEQAHGSRPRPYNGSSSRMQVARQTKGESPCRSICPATQPYYAQTLARRANGRSARVWS